MFLLSLFVTGTNIEILLLTVQILQLLMELESQYGVLTPYTLVIDEIMTFVSDVSSLGSSMPLIINGYTYFREPKFLYIQLNHFN